MATILEIPSDLEPHEFLPVINDRLRAITDALNRAGQGSTTIIRQSTGGGGGGGGSPTPNGYYLNAIVADHVAIDLANGIRHRLIIDQATQVIFDAPIFTAGTIAPGDSFILYLEQDATGGRLTPAFDMGGFISDTGSFEIDGTASTRSVYLFTFHSNSLWGVDNFLTGRQIT